MCSGPQAQRLSALCLTAFDDRRFPDKHCILRNCLVILLVAALGGVTYIEAPSSFGISLGRSSKSLIQLVHEDREECEVLSERLRSTMASEGSSEAWMASLLASRADSNGRLLVLAFNSGYVDMLSNALCRLQQLEIRNWVVGALDPKAWTTCVERGLACFPAGAAGATQDSNATTFGTEGFRRVVKKKSKAVLRILRLGYDVLFVDTDIFLKVNPFPRVEANCGDADVCIQSDVSRFHKAEVLLHKNMSLCSGFYLARSRNSTIRAFEEITALHSRDKRNTQSEQPGFYVVLCGPEGEFVELPDKCVNRVLGVRTHVLPRDIYMNGDILNSRGNVSLGSRDSVVIAHFNWRKGHTAKVWSMYNASMWVTSEEGTCACRGSRIPSRIRRFL